VGVEELRTEGEMEMGKEVPVNPSLDSPPLEVAREGNDVVGQASGQMKVGEEAGETSEKDAVCEVQETVGDERVEESDKTKEGKPAKVGEKRGRGSQGQTSGEQVTMEEETKKEAKKARNDKGEGESHEGKKKRGRPPKAKTPKTKSPSTEGKKRPVGRPRRATIASAKVDVTMEESGDPAHHTRSKDATSRA